MMSNDGINTSCNNKTEVGLDVKNAQIDDELSLFWVKIMQLLLPEM